MCFSAQNPPTHRLIWRAVIAQLDSISRQALRWCPVERQVLRRGRLIDDDLYSIAVSSAGFATQLRYRCVADSNRVPISVRMCVCVCVSTGFRPREKERRRDDENPRVAISARRSDAPRRRADVAEQLDESKTDTASKTRFTRGRLSDDLVVARSSDGRVAIGAPTLWKMHDQTSNSGKTRRVSPSRKPLTLINQFINLLGFRTQG